MFLRSWMKVRFEAAKNWWNFCQLLLHLPVVCKMRSWKIFRKNMYMYYDGFGYYLVIGIISSRAFSRKYIQNIWGGHVPSTPIPVLLVLIYLYNKILQSKKRNYIYIYILLLLLRYIYIRKTHNFITKILKTNLGETANGVSIKEGKNQKIPTHTNIVYRTIEFVRAIKNEIMKGLL